MIRFFVLSIFFIFLAGCEQNPYIVLNCPETNEPVTILKDVSKVFPVYGSSYSANLDSTIKILKKLEASLSGNMKKNISKIREDLNQENIQIETMLKTAVLALQNTPCDTKVRDNFWVALKDINDRGLKLNKLKNSLENKITSVSDVNTRSSVKIEILRGFLSNYSFYR